jgi:hypothetical protein
MVMSMTRRKMLAANAAGMTMAAAQGAKEARQYIVMRKLYLRNSADQQVAKLGPYLEKTVMPALGRAGATGMGFFASLIAPDSPFHLVIASFPTMAAIEDSFAKMDKDAAFQKGLKEYYGGGGLRYQRVETSLFYGFEGFPGLTKIAPGKAPRVFELRTYESDNFHTLAEKVKMFNQGEIEIFKKTGLEPVFFGESVFGANQPNLTYMLCYDDLAAREANWKKFVGHAEWLKLRATPGWSDAEIVSNISNIMLRPLPFSPIR